MNNQLVFCEGEKVYLRMANVDDADILAKWKQDPYLTLNLLVPMETNIEPVNTGFSKV